MTVMLAIFSSLFLSMTILPAAAAWMSHRTSTAHQAGFLATLFHHGITLPGVTLTYRRSLRYLLAHPWLGIAIGCVLPLAGFAAATQLSEQFFPPADRDQFYIEMELQPDASLALRPKRAQSNSLTKSLTNSSLSPHVFGTRLGSSAHSAPAFYYNIISRRKGNPNHVQAMVTLDSNANARSLIRQLQTELSDRFPMARILVRELEQGPPVHVPLEVRVFGPDLEVLKQLGEQLRGLATAIPQVIHTRTALSDNRPVASIEVDARQAAWAGLNEAEVASQLFTRLEGIPAGSIIEQVEAASSASTRRRVASPITGRPL